MCCRLHSCSQRHPRQGAAVALGAAAHWGSFSAQHQPLIGAAVMAAYPAMPQLEDFDGACTLPLPSDFQMQKPVIFWLDPEDEALAGAEYDSGDDDSRGSSIIAGDGVAGGKYDGSDGSGVRFHCDSMQASDASEALPEAPPSESAVDTPGEHAAEVRPVGSAGPASAVGLDSTLGTTAAAVPRTCQGTVVGSGAGGRGGSSGSCGGNDGIYLGCGCGAACFDVGKLKRGRDDGSSVGKVAGCSTGTDSPGAKLHSPQVSRANAPAVSCDSDFNTAIPAASASLGRGAVPVRYGIPYPYAVRAVTAASGNDTRRSLSPGSGDGVVPSVQHEGQGRQREHPAKRRRCCCVWECRCSPAADACFPAACHAPHMQHVLRSDAASRAQAQHVQLFSTQPRATASRAQQQQLQMLRPPGLQLAAAAATRPGARDFAPRAGLYGEGWNRTENVLATTRQQPHESRRGVCDMRAATAPLQQQHSMTQRQPLQHGTPTAVPFPAVAVRPQSAPSSPVAGFPSSKCLPYRASSSSSACRTPVSLPASCFTPAVPNSQPAACDCLACKRSGGIAAPSSVANSAFGSMLGVCAGAPAAGSSSPYPTRAACWGPEAVTVKTFRPSGNSPGRTTVGPTPLAAFPAPSPAPPMTYVVTTGAFLPPGGRALLPPPSFDSRTTSPVPPSQQQQQRGQPQLQQPSPQQQEAARPASIPLVPQHQQPQERQQQHMQRAHGHLPRPGLTPKASIPVPQQQHMQQMLPSQQQHLPMPLPCHITYTPRRYRHSRSQQQQPQAQQQPSPAPSATAAAAATPKRTTPPASPWAAAAAATAAAHAADMQSTTGAPAALAVAIQVAPPECCAAHGMLAAMGPARAHPQGTPLAFHSAALASAAGTSTAGGAAGGGAAFRPPASEPTEIDKQQATAPRPISAVEPRHAGLRAAPCSMGSAAATVTPGVPRASAFTPVRPQSAPSAPTPAVVASRQQCRCPGCMRQAARQQLPQQQAVDATAAVERARQLGVVLPAAAAAAALAAPAGAPKQQRVLGPQVVAAAAAAMVGAAVALADQRRQQQLPPPRGSSR
ncbi:hypothetical protein Agub_g13962 [Astrephomene gubernaculifera]|uniref:Uncharacterized protein n=1 Tax=Astrephomene gubernaculifera TaxID=47775 RepID=A0AAD3HRW7_9CHLO|nr:hypothetical protein Agub_g13962 [Astrephomene gubernaculifera]